MPSLLTVNSGRAEAEWMTPAVALRQQDSSVGQHGRSVMLRELKGQLARLAAGRFEHKSADGGWLYWDRNFGHRRSRLGFVRKQCRTHRAAGIAVSIEDARPPSLLINLPVAGRQLCPRRKRAGVVGNYRITCAARPSEAPARARNPAALPSHRALPGG